jgi:hypothetical protein
MPNTKTRKSSDASFMFLKKTGGTMTGNLSVLNPSSDLHVSTKSYTQTYPAPNQVIFSGMLLQNKGTNPDSLVASYGATAWAAYERNIMVWNYTPKLSNSKVIFSLYCTPLHFGNTDWKIHFGRVYDSLGNIYWHHSWLNGTNPNSYNHMNMSFKFSVDSWGTSQKTFDYAWARYPGITNTYMYDNSVYVTEIAQ